MSQIPLLEIIVCFFLTFKKHRSTPGQGNKQTNPNSEGYWLFTRPSSPVHFAEEATSRLSVTSARA